jgi:hypothetical protein
MSADLLAAALLRASLQGALAVDAVWALCRLVPRLPAARKQQGELGRQQGELGKQQGELGKQQGELGRAQGELAREAYRQFRELLDSTLANGSAQLLE